MDDFWEYFLKNLEEFAEIREDEMLQAMVYGVRQVFKHERSKKKVESEISEVEEVN